jgi:hypothetical protein
VSEFEKRVSSPKCFRKSEKIPAAVCGEKLPPLPNYDERSSITQHLYEVPTPSELGAWRPNGEKEKEKQNRRDRRAEKNYNKKVIFRLLL